MFFEPEFKVVLVESVDVIRTSQTGGTTTQCGDSALPDDIID